MTVNAATFDPAERLDLYYRKNRDGAITLVFTSSSGGAYNISANTFILKIKYKTSDITDVLSLTSGSGLTIGGVSNNELMVSITESQSDIKSVKYYWELFNDTTNQTWLCGDFVLYTGNHADIGDSSSSTILVGGTTISVSITLAGSASSSTSSTLTPTAVKTSNYTAVAGDFVPVDTTSGSVTVTLPNTPADKSQVEVKMIIQGGTNTVTVNCAGSDTFNRTGGATSATLSLLAQAMWMQYNATLGVWYIIADDLSLSQLDLRFTPQTRKVNDIALTSDVTVITGYNKLRSGQYHLLVGTGVATPNTVALVANTLRAYQIIISSTIIITEINSEVTSAVAATKYRWGIYADNGSNYPGALVAGSDAGEYDSATTGNKPSATVSITITPGIYWVASNSNGAPTLRGISAGWTTNLGFPNTAFATMGAHRISVSLTYGAMPSTFTAGGTYAAAAIATAFFKI
jgi:hypothetical protein